MNKDKRLLKDYPWFYRSPTITKKIIPIIVTLLIFSGPIYAVATAEEDRKKVKFDAIKEFGGRTI